MFAKPGDPPKTNPSEVVPDPFLPNAPVFKLLTSVQLDPFQLSLRAEVVGGASFPPEHNADVYIPKDD